MTSISIRVDGADQTGEARRRASQVATAAGLDETSAGRLAIIVMELANNLWRHGGGGEILITPCSDGCIEVLALDRGPGMADVARCFQDGYSTAGSAGTGLGAVGRLATQHDIYTAPGKGTALLARIDCAARSRRAPDIVRGGVSVPMRGERVCGDDFAFADSDGANWLIVVDGLGHGPGAADCADAALAAFQEAALDGPADVLREVHAGLHATRGAAVAVARFDFARGELRYAGIGNIAGAIWANGAPKHLLSHPGIVGHDTRNVREITYPLPHDAVVLLYSDGITTHWSLTAYEGLLLRDPSLIAGVIYRDHSRGRDDATVVVVRAQ